MPSDPPRSAGLPPGYDESDPYEGADLDAYPDWWRRNVEEFREHGMRPYRPPRLADGTLSPPFVARLEVEHGVDVTFRSADPGGAWALVVDGDAVREVDHERDGGGYTVYGITAEELAGAVREAAGDER